MRCVRDDDVRAFAAAVLGWLKQDPVRNTVLSSVIAGAAGGYVVDGDPLWLRVLDDDGSLAGVAIRTPPHPLGLSTMSPAAAAAVADYCRSFDIDMLSSLTTSAEPFIAAWGPATLARGMRLYQLDAVKPPTGVPGRARLATEADTELAVTWQAAFAAALGSHSLGAANLRRRIGQGLIWLWEVDGEPVASASRTDASGGVVRVGFVYTPPAHRRHGYAGALVAAVSADTLAAGATACCLFTDLANPTSNHIYQEVGYYPVADSGEWTLH
ncbi:GNAT family N-acetyltransferase [Fodinicola feengrottensis]|uniref:N-acetyltransferase domain-containing protein n=1 Tax=Fodinicola feengrottensis TaxID=435914 RepID=A0ABN2I7F4_9ACTN|nr:GNAT family N-acetyltransferase [Fodinicola feengrottensis]